MTGAIYLTLAIDDDAARAEERVNAYLTQYYGQPPELLRKTQACYGGPPEGAAQWLTGYADAGASHLVLRFVGGQEHHQETVARVREDLGW